MGDLIERLRAIEGVAFVHAGQVGIEDVAICHEAADTIEAQATRLAALEAAGKALYLAGKWELHDTDILPYGQAVMWGNLRDALGLPPGTATALAQQEPTP